jgi:hypothetical protein
MGYWMRWSTRGDGNNRSIDCAASREVAPGLIVERSGKRK